ncbi:MAG: hypothetical protein FJX56_04605 [Alphaproteobacteria bacterium]|nr:hypothetical protein [Alphaproteobacteria bacterium]
MRARLADAALVTLAAAGTALGLTLVRSGIVEGPADAPALSRLGLGFALYLAAFAASLVLLARRAVAVVQPLVTGASLVAAFALDAVIEPSSVRAVSLIGAALVLGGVALLARDL